MKEPFINLTLDNLEEEHMCCIVRTKKLHPGIEAKKKWLFERLKEGHVFRKLNEKATVFIEYAPLETAWVPIVGNNYYYIYCLWVTGEHKGKGYAKELIEYCIEDARRNAKAGICMLGSKKQKHWLSDQSFVKKFGFKVTDTTETGYELLALSLDGTYPSFPSCAKEGRIDTQELTIYYDVQCPYIYRFINSVKEYCETKAIPLSLICVDTLEKAKQLPCVFNNYVVLYKGKFQTVNLLDIASLERLLQK